MLRTAKLALFIFFFLGQVKALSHSIKLKAKLARILFFPTRSMTAPHFSSPLAESRRDLSFNARDTLNSNIHYRGITLERTPRFTVIGLGFIGRRATVVRVAREKGSGRFLKGREGEYCAAGVSGSALIRREEIL